MLVLWSSFLVLAAIVSTVSAAVSKEDMIFMACVRNPRLSFCHETPTTRSPLDEVESVESAAAMRARLRAKLRRPDPSTAEGFVPQEGPEGDTPPAVSTKDQPTAKEQEFVDKLTGADLIKLQNKCSQFGQLAMHYCRAGKVEKANIPRCAAYFRDCYRFFTKSDPLQGIAQSFSSAVGLNLGSASVNGIPYYPINEEGGVAAGRIANIPFGSWGGGYSENIGARDYWSQFQEVGANWYDGKYGYKNGWTVPLVQSLGIEGGQHNTVGVPLHGPRAGAIDVDNGYGVGPYFQDNLHQGVNWRKGEVSSIFGVGAPIAGVGVTTGVGVAFPGADTWLGRK